MQCSSIFYPQTHKIWCFKPSLSVTPPPQQQQQQRTSHEEKPKPITSVSNPFVKHCLKLRNSSSYRRSHASAIVVGATPIRSHVFPSVFLSILLFFLRVEVLWQWPFMIFFSFQIMFVGYVNVVFLSYMTVQIPIFWEKK